MCVRVISVSKNNVDLQMCVYCCVLQSVWNNLISLEITVKYFAPQDIMQCNSFECPGKVTIPC